MDFPGRDAESTTPGVVPVRQSAPEDSGLQEIPLVELLRWLTAEIRLHHGCAEVQVVGVERMDRPGPDGCNWGYSVTLDLYSAKWYAYVPAYLDVVARGRAQFNLK
jgi:hypothetical protein